MSAIGSCYSERIGGGYQRDQWVGPGRGGRVDYARDDLGLDTLTAIVSRGNTPSIGLIEKLGLSFSGMITMPGDDEEICLYGMTLGKE